MPNTLEERDWELLLRRIKDGKCTPFLGAGACFGALPLGGEIAQKWAQEHEYPLEDCHDLARVAQYLADDPRPPDVVQLEQDVYWLRVNDHRVIYKVLDEERIILIGRIVRRSEGTY